MKAAIYVRVSTDKQELENQLHPLLEYANRQGYEVVKVYKDIASGKDSNRKEFNIMMNDAHKKKFDVILVWSLDRLSREGLYKTVNLLQHLTNIGVNIISYTEPYINTTDEIVRSVMLALLSTLAKAEREKISERTKAGLQRAKQLGVRIGRPKTDEKVVAKIQKLLKAGFSIREVAGECGVSPSLVYKVKKGVYKRGTEFEQKITDEVKI